jgi:hypothetical protein
LIRQDAGNLTVAACTGALHRGMLCEGVTGNLENIVEVCG